MKKFALITLAGFASIVSAEGFYLRGNLGGSIMAEDVEFSGQKISVDNGVLVGFALGYQIAPNFAVEGDVRYRGMDASDDWKSTSGTASLETDVDIMSYMVNGVYEFDLDNVKPYVKMGLGFANIDAEGKASLAGKTVTYSFDDSDTNVAWAIGTGANFQLDKSWQINLDYQFLSAGDIEVKKDANKADVDVQSHEISIGVRYDF